MKPLLYKDATPEIVSDVTNLIEKYNTNRLISRSKVFELYNLIYGKQDAESSCRSCVLHRFRPLQEWLFHYHKWLENDKQPLPRDKKGQFARALILMKGIKIFHYFDDTYQNVYGNDLEDGIYQVRKTGEIIEIGAKELKEPEILENGNTNIPTDKIDNEVKESIEEMQEVSQMLQLENGDIIMIDHNSKAIDMDGKTLMPGKYPLNDGRKLVVNIKRLGRIDNN